MTLDPASEPARRASPRNHPHSWPILIALMLGMWLAALDQTIVSAA